jgi:two-component system, NarL family, sensor histidine kinase UhpB
MPTERTTSPDRHLDGKSTAGRLPAGWQNIAALTLAAIVSWLLIDWVDVGSPSIADLLVKRIEFAKLTRPDPAELPTAQFEPKTKPFRHESRFGVARITFDVADPQTADVALLVRRIRDNYAVYLNDHLAAPAPGAIGERSTLHGFHPRLVRLLPQQLVRGPNTIDIICASNGPVITVGQIYVGQAARLEPAHVHALAIIRDNAEIAALAAGMVLLFALALSPMVRPALTLTIAATLGFFLARLLHTLWVDQPWPQPFRDIYLNATAIPIWISCIAFVNEWTNGPKSYRWWLMAACGVAWLLLGAFYLTMHSVQANSVAGPLESATGFCALTFMVQRLTRHYFQAPAAAAPEIFVASVGLCMACASVATQTAIVPALRPINLPQGEAFSQLGAMAIIAFIAVGLARHGVGIYRLAAMNNETLTRQVREKERELEANHTLLREQERERALTAERSRIMRDVHDGIGSQLLGLMVQARAGQSKPETMTAGLQAAIDDLYLVVDSLDGIDGSLETALGTFRSRVEPKCAAAGIEIGWHMDHVGSTNALGPASVLQLYRILQEALSNAIRHGRPKHVTFTLRRDAPTERVALTLQDDGAGFDAGAPATGRGLTNMRKRAASIGADLDVTSGGTGTCVKVLLPA